ncbi:ISXoo2 transposase [mine drainage metagenome]|uniref:ISXoo2 transposase n=2 Tax=mine drainage metagenome TaxID=410659 RepID=T1BXY6_9ZZZZ
MRWIQGQNPMPYGFDFGLWTRRLVRERVQREFEVTLSLASIGALLARLGWTAPKPLQRADPRDPQAMERWPRETDPALARRAQNEQAEIYFWDASGFRADAVQGKTWGLNGPTPVVSVPGPRPAISAASAVNGQGACWLDPSVGALNGARFVGLLKQLMDRRRRPLHRVIDGLPAHRKAVVRDSVASTKGRLTLHFLPGYAPELNPDEWVWSDTQRTGHARRPLHKGEKLEPRVTAQLTAIGNHPKRVRSFFKHPVLPILLTYE